MKHAILPLVSSYSFRFGVESPEVLAGALAERGFVAGVLADRGGVPGQLGFRHACRDRGVESGAGARLEIGGIDALYVALNGGWSGLCGLVTSSSSPDRIAPIEAFAAASRVMAITDSTGDAASLKRVLGFSGPVRVAVLPEVLSGHPPGAVENRVTAAGEWPIAVWPSVFAGREAIGRHRVLIRGYRAIEGTDRDQGRFAAVGNIMPDGAVFRRAFHGASRSLRANAELAEAIVMEPVIEGVELIRDPEEEERLRALVNGRFAGVYGSSRTAAKRLGMELEDICVNGLAGYFLDFSKIVEFAKSKGIAVSARGSAGGSTVSYLLGLSIVCPIRHGLSFSRFFNRLRSSPPDIDLDIDSSRRDEVMEWFLGRAGRRGASVSEVVKHRIRSAFRVAATGLGMGSEEMDTLSKLLRRRNSQAWRRPLAARSLEDAELLVGLPSNLAPHPCGIVRTAGPVDLIVPVQPSANGLRITQFDKDGVEEIGLLKMDLLGQRGLTTLSGVCRVMGGRPHDIFRRGGDIPESARELLDSGRTIGVVHVESPALRGLMKEMSIRTMEDVARALALVRPGASAGGGRRRYMDRLHGGDVMDDGLPELMPILRENLGVMLYQEDVSRAAEILLGLDEAGGDLLRRRLKKKQVPAEELIEACRSRGFSMARSKAAWEVLSGYAGYGFCKAHAFTYGAVACAAASLKAERPALYMASVMAAGGGFYGSRTYLEEGRRLGVGFDPPGVNTGRWLSCERQGRIVVGFHHLRGLGATEFEKLKKGRPYRSPSDLSGAGLGPVLCRSMAAVGCFGEMGYTPPAALMQLEAGGGGLFPGDAPGLPGLPDYSMRVRISMELGMLGLPLAGSPLSLEPRPPGTTPASELPSSGSVRLWGRSVTGRRLANGAGFLMLEDDTGIADVFLPSPLYYRAEDLLVRPESTLVVTGTVDRGGRTKAYSIGEGPLTVTPTQPESPE